MDMKNIEKFCLEIVHRAKLSEILLDDSLHQELDKIIDLIHKIEIELDLYRDF